MTLTCRINERVINAMLIGLLFLVAGLYAVQAQNPETGTTNATKKVNYASKSNFDAKATSLNPAINSGYAELKPAIAPGGDRLYFSRSLHPNNTFGGADYEDIWYSDFNATSGSWSDPVRMTGHLNNAGPNFINNVSLTGDTLILGNQYMKRGKMRAGLSYSVNVKGKWSAPTPIHIVNDYNVSDHANSYVSIMSGVIISSVERVETVGKRDLYVSFWDGTKATEPINMGGVINTELEESSPYLAADEKTLYFASKGHNGLGGFDIFVTKRLDDSWTNWSEPENLGPAVNGKLDDEYFSISHCGNYAVFSRQISVHNTDIFRISMEELFGQSDLMLPKEVKTIISALASL